MIANPHKYCLLHYRKQDLEFMRELANIMMQKTEPEVRAELESVIKEFGLGCRQLGDEIRTLPEFVDENKVDPKWQWRARWIKMEVDNILSPSESKV